MPEKKRKLYRILEKYLREKREEKKKKGILGKRKKKKKKKKKSLHLAIIRHVRERSMLSSQERPISREHYWSRRKSIWCGDNLISIFPLPREDGWLKLTAVPIGNK